MWCLVFKTINMDFRKYFTIIIMIVISILSIIGAWMIAISSTCNTHSTGKPQHLTRHSTERPKNVTEIDAWRKICQPNPCQNGGVCSPNSNDFLCYCGGTGYGGAVCHTPKYPLSCTTIKSNKQILDTLIDLDGSGPLKPFPVSCEFYVDQGDIYTTLKHSHTHFIKVDGFEEPGSFHHPLLYDAGPLEIEMLVNRSRICYQPLLYYCKNAKIFNSPYGPGPFRPTSWLVSRSNKSMDFWAETSVGSRKCACGVKEVCIDPRVFCNCDADQSEWTDDSGFIREKEYLPIMAVKVGGTGTVDDDKIVQFSVGALYCSDDTFFSNTITFAKTTIELPPFNMGLTGDIYLEFMTAARDAVLFHAIGPTDYLKLSIVNGMTLHFQCKGGNESLILEVQAANSFNGTRWHTVYVERNRKEIQLIMDGSIETQVRNSVPDYPHQITSNLIIGGTINHTNIYVGSMRALLLNGVMVDLLKYRVH